VLRSTVDRKQKAAVRRVQHEIGQVDQALELARERLAQKRRDFAEAKAGGSEVAGDLAAAVDREHEDLAALVRHRELLEEARGVALRNLEAVQRSAPDERTLAELEAQGLALFGRVDELMSELVTAGDQLEQWYRASMRLLGREHGLQDAPWAVLDAIRHRCEDWRRSSVVQGGWREPEPRPEPEAAAPAIEAREIAEEHPA
jgi:hypothetical protein